MPWLQHGAIFWNLLAGELVHAFGVTLLGVQAFLNPSQLFMERSRGSDTHATAEGIPAAKGNHDLVFREVLRDWRTWAFCYVISAMTFCGRSIKMLLSVIFEQALTLSYIDSVRLSAGYLCVYCLGRGLTPLFATRNRVFSIVYECSRS